jgi:predicted AlkP superfamily pyrophosphatase or phosphodiesterase
VKARSLVLLGSSLLAIAFAGCKGSSGPDGAPGQNAPVSFRAGHVLLLSIDGLHASDLQRWIAANPTSALAQLAQTGITYSAARTPTPSDSFPGVLALVTGGTPKSTGVYYDDSYDRTMYPPGSDCAEAKGAEIIYDESIGADLTRLFSSIDPTKLPMQVDAAGNCRAVYPHSFLRVNTIFEVAKAAGLRTAWSDKHPAYDLLNGPSGSGVDDLYTPEINSSVVRAVVQGVDMGAALSACNATNSLGGAKVTDHTTCSPTVLAYDDVKVQAVLNWIDGKASDGSAGTGIVPAIFGMNFQGVSVGQKLPAGGYIDPTTFSTVLQASIAHTDASIGRMVAELKAKGLYSSTLVIVTAKHGQSPIDRTKLAMEGGGHAAILNVVDPINYINAVDPTVDVSSSGGGHFQTDDVGILWLSNQSTSNVNAIVSALMDPTNASSIHATTAPAGFALAHNVSSGAELASLFGDATSPIDPVAAARAPDVFIQPNEGVIYSGSSKKIAEHGGGAPGDVGVALLVSNPSFRAATISTPVMTTRVAPTILQALGLEPFSLEALQKEGTPTLPGIFP